MPNLEIRIIKSPQNDGSGIVIISGPITFKTIFTSMGMKQGQCYDIEKIDECSVDKITDVNTETELLFEI